MMDCNDRLKAKGIEQPPHTAVKTRRSISAGLEQRLFAEISVLDKGFVRVIDYMGNDAAIVQAARVSYGSGTKTSRNDERLIRYLMRHGHTTPFEMCEIKLHVKLPIFVARQWVRHRTANINEYSARYSILEQEFYVPAQEHLAVQNNQNKQGRAPAPLTDQGSKAVIATLQESNQTVYAIYQDMIAERDGKPGLARELARINLPTSVYTQWYWKIDLHNLLRFIKLRADTHAQYEIRAYAEALAAIVADWVPWAYAAFQDYQSGSVVFSRAQNQCLERLLKGETIAFEKSGMSESDWRLFLKTPGVQASQCRLYACAQAIAGKNHSAQTKHHVPQDSDESECKNSDAPFLL